MNKIFRINIGAVELSRLFLQQFVGRLYKVEPL